MESQTASLGPSCVTRVDCCIIKQQERDIWQNHVVPVIRRTVRYVLSLTVLP